MMPDVAGEVELAAGLEEEAEVEVDVLTAVVVGVMGIVVLAFMVVEDVTGGMDEMAVDVATLLTTLERGRH